MSWVPFQPAGIISTLALAAVLLGSAPPRLIATDGGEELSAEELVKGRKLFSLHCARCHGMQGLGGTGPNLARPTQAADFKSVLAIIELGIPGTAMPAWRLIPRKDQRSVAGFVRALANLPAVALHGDPARGQAVFQRSGCSQCHTVGGVGGVIGPDLTQVGLRRGPDQMRGMLLEPGRDKLISGDGYYEYVPVHVVTLGGEEIYGLRMNEDGFTLQLRDAANQVHSLRKSEIKQLEKEFERSLMPSFAGVLNADELDDVVAYLATLRGKK